MVAIKVLNLDTSEQNVADIRREISMLSQLKQADVQNVTRYHGSLLHGDKLWIIMDYCHGGSIRTLMKAGKIGEKYCSVIMREVLLALSYIHRSGIIHRDVKAANVLVANDGSVQLCDFGVATQLASNHLKRSTFVGTPYWMAPEVITEGSSYNSKADIWSLGITLYEIATGNPPYADQEPMRAIITIPRNLPARLEGPNYSQYMKEFLALCLHKNPNERPPAEELARTKFIKLMSKTPTSCLRDLILRFEKWQESGGIRKSLLLHERRGSGLSDLQVDLMENDEPVGWDFDTVRSHIRPKEDRNNNEDQNKLENALDGNTALDPMNPNSFNAPQSEFSSNGEIQPPVDAVLAHTIRPMLSRAASSNLGSTVLSKQSSSSTAVSSSDHRLLQLFDDPENTNQDVGGTRGRKDSVARLRPSSPSPLSIPSFPLKTKNISASPINNEIPEYRYPSESGTMKLPEIPASEPFQIEIPPPNEAFNKPEKPASISRRPTVGRMAAPPIHLPSIATAALEVQTSPSRTVRGVSPNPSVSSSSSGHIQTNNPTIASSLASPPPFPQPQNTISVPPPNFNDISSPPPIHLHLQQQQQQQQQQQNLALPRSPMHPPLPPLSNLNHIESATNSNSLPIHQIAPLNMNVLSEVPLSLSGGMVASKSLTGELERVLKDFGSLLVEVRSGLDSLEEYVQIQKYSQENTKPK